MTNKPTINKPEWATTEAIGPNVIEPTAHKTTGFIQQSGIPEKPSYQELNYLFKSTYEWFEYLETITDEAKEYIIPCGEDLAAGDIIRISGGQAFKADNTTEAGITAVAGVNANAVTSGNNARIAYGFYDAFSALTVGETYYVGVNGAITSTLPAIYQVELGVAVSTTRINLDIKSKYQTRDLEIKNSNPNIKLKNTGTGSSQIQTVDFETGDGQFAKIEGVTTGSGIGELNFNTKQSGDIAPVERLTVDSKTRIKTQHITTNSGGIVSWTGITMRNGEQCRLITEGGHITAILRVSGTGLARADFLATYSIVCDSYFPNTGIQILGQSSRASALDVYWTSDDLYVGVVSDGNFWADRDFTITLHYTGTGLNYVEDPIVT